MRSTIVRVFLFVRENVFVTISSHFGAVLLYKSGTGPLIWVLTLLVALHSTCLHVTTYNIRYKGNRAHGANFYSSAVMCCRAVQQQH